MLKRLFEKLADEERDSVRVPGRGAGEYEGGGCDRLPTDVDFVSCEGARAELDTVGWRASEVVMSRRVSRDGASSSSLQISTSARQTWHLSSEVQTCHSIQVRWSAPSRRGATTGLCAYSDAFGYHEGLCKHQTWSSSTRLRFSSRSVQDARTGEIRGALVEATLRTLLALPASALSSM